MKTQFELEDIKAVSSTVVEQIRPILKSSGGGKNEDAIFSTADLALYLQVNESWVRQRVALQEIPLFRCGKYIRFRKQDIDKWIARKTVKPIPPLKMANK